MMHSEFTRRRHQGGLSLIELIIAMALGLVLTLGVVQIFLGSGQTYRLTDGIAALQENMRFALGKLQYEGRMAGHYGCLIGEPINNLDTSNGNYDPNIYDGLGVVGWEAAGTGLDTNFTISTLEATGGTWQDSSGTAALPDDISGSVVPGNDVLVISGGKLTDITLGNGVGAPSSTLGVDDSSGIRQGAIILVIAGDCSGGEKFQHTNTASASSLTMGNNGNNPGNASSSFEGIYSSDGSVYEYTSTAYYIGVGVGGEPALYRDRLDPGIGAVELVSGVENMQVLYGVAGSEKRAEQYVPASGVTDWGLVVSIRVALLMRSADQAIDASSSRTFNLLGTRVTSQDDRRARLVGLSTIGIRNRLE